MKHMTLSVHHVKACLLSVHDGEATMLATTLSGSNEISYKSETIKVGHTFVDTFDDFDEQKFIRQRPGKTVSNEA
jgi:hypothetical protein